MSARPSAAISVDATPPMACQSRRLLFLFPEAVRCFPYNVAYLVEPAKRAGFEVSFLAPEAEGLDSAQVENHLIAGGYGVVAMTGYYSGLHEIQRLVGLIRRCSPDTIICLGGAFMTGATAYAMQRTGVDYGFVGEGDVSFAQFLKALRDGHSPLDIPGLVYWRDGKLIDNGPGEIIRDLGDVPPLDFDAFPEGLRFLRDVDIFHGERYHSLLTTRGCPYACHFCQEVCRPRSRPLPDVIAEMRHIGDRYGIHSFNVLDSVLMGGKHKAFCRALLAADLKPTIRWAGCTRFNLMDRESIELMKQSGAQGIGFGLENGDQTILDRVDKRIDLRHAEQVLRWCKEVDLRAGLTAMWGLPGEDAQTLRRTIRFLFRTNYSPSWLFVTAPYPGTKIFEQAVARGQLADEDEFYERYVDTYRRSVNLTRVSDRHFDQLWLEAKVMVGLFQRRSITAEAWLSEHTPLSPRALDRVVDHWFAAIWALPHPCFALLQRLVEVQAGGRRLLGRIRRCTGR